MKTILLTLACCSLAFAASQDYSISLRALDADPLTLENQAYEFKQLKHSFAAASTSDIALSTESGYWLIQFQGPLKPAWLKELRGKGCQDLQYMKQYCLLVRGSEESVAALAAMPFVRWIGRYRSEYKISGAIPRLDRYITHPGIPAAEKTTVVVKVFRSANLPALKSILPRINAVLLKESGGDVVDYLLRVRLPHASLSALAAISDVAWIEPSLEYHSTNDRAREDILNVRPAWSAGYRGSGQLICVADTGLDLGSKHTSQLHFDFTRTYLRTFPIGFTNVSRVVRIDDWVGDGPQDVDGHGTHVAGSVLGAGYRSGASWLITPTNALAGVAPLAQLMFQAVASNFPGSSFYGLPDSMVTLLSPAWNEGARVHHNSWGSGVRGTYTTKSSTLDSFVGNPLVPKWDNMVVVVSAGNDGVDYVTNKVPNNSHWARAGVIDYDSIGSPATAKNCITVGASENIRPTIPTIWNNSRFPRNPIRSDLRADNPNGMCAFSSRGPCDDLRIKPDIVAPGSFIASTLSRAASPNTLWGAYPPNTNYVYSGGTSMSAPLVSGAAALVREWLIKANAVSNPSAALVKALMLNNTASMYPGQYANDFLEIPATVPNNVNGYGLLDLQNIIAPTNSSTRLWWDRGGPLTTGITNEHEFVVDDPSLPLRVMLVWSDIPATAAANGGLVNDLDLVIEKPNQLNYKGLPRDYRYILSHDDNSTDGYISNVTGEGFAEKFTPDHYPVRLWGAQCRVAWMGPGIQYDINVYDDNGVGGSPGTLLFTSHKQGGTFGWDDTFLPNMSIESGSFYIELRCLQNIYPGPYYTEEAGPGTSWHWNGATWTRPSRQYMIHAVMRDLNTEAHDRVNNVQHYRFSSPDAGTWKVKVIGHDVWLPQNYALTVSGGVEVPEPGFAFMIISLIGISLFFKRY